MVPKGKAAVGGRAWPAIRLLHTWTEGARQAPPLGPFLVIPTASGLHSWTQA